MEKITESISYESSRGVEKSSVNVAVDVAAVVYFDLSALRLCTLVRRALLQSSWYGGEQGSGERCRGHGRREVERQTATRLDTACVNRYKHCLPRV